MDLFTQPTPSLGLSGFHAGINIYLQRKASAGYRHYNATDLYHLLEFFGLSACVIAQKEATVSLKLIKQTQVGTILILDAAVNQI